MYFASAVHLDLDGQLTGINLDKCRLGLVEKADEIETSLRKWAGDGEAPAEAVLDAVERLAHILRIVNAEGNGFSGVVELGNKLRPEKGRKPFDGEGAVAVGGAAGIDEAANKLLVNGLKFGQFELTESGCGQAQKKEGMFDTHSTNS
jgi:hypothetical protein